MANLTATKITALDKARSSGHFADGLGLYFVVPDKGRSYWAYRYTAHGRRRQMTLGQYPYMGLADARAEVMIKKRELLASIDPLVAKRQEAWNGIETMDDLFEDWFRQDIRPASSIPRYRRASIKKK